MNLELNTNTKKKDKIDSVVLRVSLLKTKDGKGIANRLIRYSKEKGIKEQDAIRYFLNNGLDRLGY